MSSAFRPPTVKPRSRSRSLSSGTRKVLRSSPLLAAVRVVPVLCVVPVRGVRTGKAPYRRADRSRENMAGCVNADAGEHVRKNNPNALTDINRSIASCPSNGKKMRWRLLVPMVLPRICCYRRLLIHSPLARSRSASRSRVPINGILMRYPPPDLTPQQRWPARSACPRRRRGRRSSPSITNPSSELSSVRRFAASPLGWYRRFFSLMAQI